MLDFSLRAYQKYLSALKKSYPQVLRFDEYLRINPKPTKFCLIRHDVDRKPHNALVMARLEHDMGLRATYYFRARNSVFKPRLVQAIHEMGHEIGYHYESLSDAQGNAELALQDFESNLKRFRAFVDINTISMHGRPLSRYDNRDLWRPEENNRRLKEHFKIQGEIYLDIDYSDIAYICDTGRNWSSDRNNLRDQVSSQVDANFPDGAALLSALQAGCFSRIVFQVHPERWTDQPVEWIAQYASDILTNAAKTLLRRLQ